MAKYSSIVAAALALAHASDVSSSKRIFRTRDAVGNTEGGGALGVGRRAQITGSMTWGGGPVMHRATAYFIYYGAWTPSSGGGILEDMIRGMGGSPWMNIQYTYTDAAGPATTAVSFGGNISVSSALYGTALTDAAVWNIVQSALVANRLPVDTNGIYFVIPSSDVSETSGFCSQYCGWHDVHSYGLQGQKIKYSFIGHAGRCPSSCGVSSSHAPNGNAAIDAMASTLGE